MPAAANDDKWGRFELLSTRTQSDMSGEVSLEVTLRDGESEVATRGVGNGPVSAFLEVVREQGFDITLYDYVEQAGGTTETNPALADPDMSPRERRIREALDD